MPTNLVPPELALRVTVECCGVTRRLIGAERLSLVFDEGSTVQTVFDSLAIRSTELADVLTRCACARGDTIVPRSTRLADSDELALLPPVAGG